MKIVLNISFLLLLISCSKKITPKKLEGNWETTTIEGSKILTNNNGITTNYSISYDGKTYSFLGTDNDFKNIKEQSISISFDKNGTYTKTTITTTYDTLNVSYYTQNGSYYNFIGNLTQNRKLIEKEVITGTYTISGGTGDIEKNSLIIFSETEKKTTNDYTYEYYDGSTIFTNYTGYYVNSPNGTFNSPYMEMSNQYSYNSDYKLVNEYVDFYHVDSYKKDEIIINYEVLEDSETGSFYEKEVQKITLKRK
jgi:hypothetical protein